MAATSSTGTATAEEVSANIANISKHSVDNPSLCEYLLHLLDQSEFLQIFALKATGIQWAKLVRAWNTEVI